MSDPTNPRAFPSSAIDDDFGGMQCRRCDLPASHKQGRLWLCPMHYRFGQMRAGAKRRGLAVPSPELLARLAAKGLNCPDCGHPMHWLAREGQTYVATLQHYRDGTFGIVCRSCNTRHAACPGDSYRDIPKDQKYCRKCERVLPHSDFDTDSGRGGFLRLKSRCKSCSRDSLAAWRSKNRDRYNAYHRDMRAKRKADAMLAERAKRFPQPVGGEV